MAALGLLLLLFSHAWSQAHPKFKVVLLPLVTTGDYKPLDVAETTRFLLEEFQGQEMEIITLSLPSGMDKEKAKEMCAEHGAKLVVWGSLRYLTFSSPQDVTVSLETEVTVWVSHRRTRLNFQFKENRFVKGENLNFEQHQKDLAMEALTEVRSMLKLTLIEQAARPALPSMGSNPAP